MNKHTRGFTLVELLAVIAIIGVLAAIVLATLGTIREKARLVGCRSNIRQVGLALELYSNDNKGFYPPAQVLNDGDDNGWIWCSTLIRGNYLDRRILLCPGDTVNQAALKYAGTNPPETGRSYSYCARVMSNNTHDKGTPLQKSLVETPSWQYMLTEWHGAAYSWKGHAGELANYTLATNSTANISPSHKNGGRHFVFIDCHVEWRTPDKFGDINSGWRLNNKP
ncbi:type II secretion system protein [Opitutaceae bacterium TAV4]|nr:type II secretion system protein [Opitutaceae bacterium TAV4]RRJ98496.1 type II secretion system protein [Opitutaceae bacterium TAV3]